MGDVKTMFDALDEEGRAALLLQLLLFSAAYMKRKGLSSANPKTTENYVEAGLADVTVGIYGLETDDKSLFSFLAAAIGKRIDLDAGKPPDGPHPPEKLQWFGN